MANAKTPLVKQVDKFNDKTTTEASIKLIMRPHKGGGNTFFRLRHVSVPNLDSLLLDVEVHLSDWYHFEDGALTFHINGVKNMQLKPHNQGNDVYTGQNRAVCVENNHYSLTQEQLKELCDAQTLEVQLRGRHNAAIEYDGSEFIQYCRLFYNQFYDESAYPEIMKTYWPKFYKATFGTKGAKIGFLIMSLGCMIGGICGAYGPPMDIFMILLGFIGLVFLFVTISSQKNR